MIAVLLLCALAPPPFSHKLHLQLKLGCADCHARAASSTSASDNLLPARKVCLKCHQDADAVLPGRDRQGAVLPSAPHPRAVSRFNHQLHLKRGNLAPVIAAAVKSGQYLGPNPPRPGSKNPCEACHRGMEQSDAVTKAALPQMADCLVCHNRIDPPFSCEKCHDNVAKLVPASHTPDWVDVHSSGKAKLDKASCAVCHGRKFTCQGCH